MVKRTGFSLISIMVATALIGVAGQVIFNSLSNSKRVPFAVSLQAELYATELLDLLRAHSSAGLLNYLKVNPVTASTTSLYPLCSHINILDRNSGKIFNKDDLAALPADVSGASSGIVMNRFYMVNVVNIQTLQIVKNPYCSKTAADILSGSPSLAADERLMVTVGVSFLNPAQPAEPPQRIIQTTVLPS